MGIPFDFRKFTEESLDVRKQIGMIIHSKVRKGQNINEQIFHSLILYHEFNRVTETTKVVLEKLGISKEDIEEATILGIDEVNETKERFFK